MSVSLINSSMAAAPQAAQNGIASQRAARPELQPAVIVDAQPVEAIADPTILSTGASGPLFNLVGVAAYHAIMNPQSSTSMSIEA
jgi:hypothetical protein